MTWDQAKSLIDNAQRIIIISHISPDGDAVGTLLGLGLTLRHLGKTVTMVIDDGVPPSLQFMPGTADIRAVLKDVQADLAITVDCSDESRMGNAGKAMRELHIPLLVIDHHVSNTNFGDVNVVKPEASAASECVLELLEFMHVPIQADAAQCLLCGLVTDTLCFRTSSTTSATLGMAQRLMDYGGDLSYVVQHTVSRMATNTIKLWGQVMPTVRIEDHVIWARITMAARQAADGAGGGDTKDGGLSSVLVQADSAFISCVMHEKENNQVELSFRAVPGFNVSKVAVSIGGGGHILASGATVPGTLDEVEARVIPLLKEAARSGAPAFA